MIRHVRSGRKSQLMQLSNGFKIASTGHRKIHDRAAVAKHSRAFLSTVKKHYPEVMLLTGMALGVDQIVAKSAVDLKIPFIAAVPFEDFPNKWAPVSQQ